MVRNEMKAKISNSVSRERWMTKGDKDNNRRVRDSQSER
jgi:hypothetical protein